MILNVRAILSKYKITPTGVIHVGAHYGVEYGLYRRMPSIKEIIFFEPDPTSFRILKGNVGGDKLVRCENTALGSSPAIGTLYRETQNCGQSNSLLQPAMHTKQYPHIVFNSTCEVHINTLDSYQLGNEFNMLNMDVQGYEMEVLLGATTTLKNVMIINTEVNRAELYKGCALFKNLNNFLTQQGFKLVGLNWCGGTWGDAFYVREGMV